MLNPFTGRDQEALQEKIEDIFSAMSVEGPTSEEYPTLITSLEKLTSLRDGEPIFKQVDLGQIVTVVGYAASVVLICVAEQRGNALFSKALPNLFKPKM